MATKYWNPSTGLNSYDGNSPTVDGGGVGPYLDFSKYINDGTTSAGDILILADGTYAGANYIITPTTSGTAGSKITLKATNPCTPLYTSPLTMVSKTANSIIDGEGTRNVFNLGSVNHWRIEGIAGINSVGDTVQSLGRIGHQLSNVRIVDAGGNGGNFENATSYSVDNVEIDGAALTGLKMGGTAPNYCSDVYVGYVYAHGVDKDGMKIFCSNTTGGNIIEFCRLSNPVFGGDHEDGIVVGPTSNLQIRYSIIEGYTQLLPIGGSDGDEVTIEDLLILGNIFWNDGNWAGDSPAIFSDSRGNRTQTMQRIYVVRNTFGLLCRTGTTAAAITLASDGQEGALGMIARDNAYVDVRGLNTKSAYAADSEWDGNFLADYNLFHELVDSSGEANSLYDTDPLMVDPANGDFRPTAGSPLIDAGDPNLPTVVPSLPDPLFDITGRVRQRNGGTIGALDFGGNLVMVKVG